MDGTRDDRLGTADTETALPDPAARAVHRSRRPRCVASSPALTGLWRAGVAVVGGAVLLIGFITLVTPGPAFVLIPAGLAVLATEFAWAARWFARARRAAVHAKERAAATSPARKVLGVAAGLGLTAAAVAGYVWLFGWPPLAVDAWHWIGGLLA